MLSALLSAGLLCGFADIADARPKITAVRLGTHKAITRFVITVDQPIRYRVFVLSNPYRVVIDMPAVDWRVARDFKLRTGGPVAAFRFGAFTPDTTRVVLDVRRPMRVQRSFPVPPGPKIKSWRLVVDLQAISKTEFARLKEERRSRPAPPGQKRAGPVRKDARPPGAKPVIVLDPGHGGVDFGANGLRGTAEKTVVLKFAGQLRSKLERSGRYKVLLTRDRDYYIPLRKRYEIARRAGAELFISIHADAHRIRKTSGLSVYTLSERASDREAEALARRENRSDAIAGIDLKRESGRVAGILIDLAQRETMNLSSRFAQFTVKEVRRVTRVLVRPHRFAGFAVLKAPDVPSLLIELGFLTNRRDEQLLRRAGHRDRIAGAMVRAVNHYFNYLRKVRDRRRAGHN